MKLQLIEKLMEKIAQLYKNPSDYIKLEDTPYSGPNRPYGGPKWVDPIGTLEGFAFGPIEGLDDEIRPVKYTYGKINLIDFLKSYYGNDLKKIIRSAIEYNKKAKLFNISRPINYAINEKILSNPNIYAYALVGGGKKHPLAPAFINYNDTFIFPIGDLTYDTPSTLINFSDKPIPPEYVTTTKGSDLDVYLKLLDKIYTNRKDRDEIIKNFDLISGYISKNDAIPLKTEYASHSAKGSLGNVISLYLMGLDPKISKRIYKEYTKNYKKSALKKVLSDTIKNNNIYEFAEIPYIIGNENKGGFGFIPMLASVQRYLYATQGKRIGDNYSYEDFVKDYLDNPNLNMKELPIEVRRFINQYRTYFKETKDDKSIKLFHDISKNLFPAVF